MKKFILIGIALLITSTSFATKILDYGFEDFDAYNGGASPADGYIFTHTEASLWTTHMGCTQVTQGGASCSGNTAYAGSYYLHTGYHSGATDSCLGAVGRVNSIASFGLDGDYPTGTTNDVHFGTEMTEATAVWRFYFRVTDDWSSAANDVIDAGGGMKFLRVAIGGDFIDDNRNVLVKLRYDYGTSSPRIGIYDGNANNTTYGTQGDWQDGEWHAFTVKSVRTGAGAYTVSIYLDDWDMESAPMHSRATIVPTPGDGSYGYAAVNGNWSAQFPVNTIGMDYDNFEVWDSLPIAAGLEVTATDIPNQAYTVTSVIPSCTATDETSVSGCRWATTDIAYASMSNTMDNVGDLYTALSPANLAVSSGNSYTIYYACIDGDTNEEGDNDSFDVAAAPSGSTITIGSGSTFTLGSGSTITLQ